jgi:hypothetical protein
MWVKGRNNRTSRYLLKLAESNIREPENNWKIQFDHNCRVIDKIIRNWRQNWILLNLLSRPCSGKMTSRSERICGKDWQRSSGQKPKFWSGKIRLKIWIRKVDCEKYEMPIPMKRNISTNINWKKSDVVHDQLVKSDFSNVKESVKTMFGHVIEKNLMNLEISPNFLFK